MTSTSHRTRAGAVLAHDSASLGSGKKPRMIKHGNRPRRPVSGPPPRHHLALMIWIAVFPTMTALQFLIGGLVRDIPVVWRTLILVTITVPIVVFFLLPVLQNLRARLLVKG
jgi:antibiotic biosynthesis monooxygenase (ABM) superfamily enzyme